MVSVIRVGKAGQWLGLCAVLWGLVAMMATPAPAASETLPLIKDLPSILSGKKDTVEKPDLVYSAEVDAKGAYWLLRVNDIDVWLQTRNGHTKKTVAIGQLLKPGKNTLSIIFLPSLSQDPETGFPILERHDGFKAAVEIKGADLDGDVKEKISLMSVAYAAGGHELVSLDQNPDGSVLQTRSDHLQTDGVFDWDRHSPIPLMDSSGASFQAERVSISFTVTDALPKTYHWQATATPLKDTPALRKGLREAYQRFYDLFAADNAKAVLDQVAPAFQRIGQTVTGDDTAQDFVDHMGGMTNLTSHPKDGRTLLPLRLEKDPRNDRLEFLADHHLVRILPSPIAWQPAATDAPVQAFPATFYLDKHGEWHVGAVPMN